MKNTNKTADATSKLSWLQRVKVAIVALAFVAAGVFGASAVSDIPAPEAEVDETAQAYWGKVSTISPDDNDRFGGFMSFGRSGSWS